MKEEYSKIALNVLIRIHLIPSIIAILVLVVIDRFYPNFISKENYLVIVLLVICGISLVISCIKTYKDTVADLKANTFIREQKRTDDAIIRMLRGMNHYEKYIEEYKMRIEIHKAITPIPILVFILGIVITWDSADFKEVLNDLIVLQITYDYVVGGILVFSGIWYVFSYKNCWEKYKFSLKRYYLYKNEYDVLSLSLNNDSASSSINK